MPVSSVLCHLSRHLVSGHIVFHQVSPSQLWSASIYLFVYRHPQYLARGIIFISPLYMSEPSQPLLWNSAIGLHIPIITIICCTSVYYFRNYTFQIRMKRNNYLLMSSLHLCYRIRRYNNQFAHQTFIFSKTFRLSESSVPEII